MKSLTFIALLAVCAPAASESAPVERYEYVALPRGETNPARQETSWSTIATTASGFRYEYTRTEADRTESGWIETDREAVFRKAFRTVERAERGIAEIDSLWRDGDRLFVLRREPTKGKEELKEFDLPGDKPLAVDASLLLWMRRFPFADGARRKVYMVDFSQHKVTVTVAQKGIETVTVPAGTFECYHLEVAVKVLILKARIHFWIATQPPHFLVRHEGKRGPFTRTYRTELVRIDGEAE
jgi:hypothetical protein